MRATKKLTLPSAMVVALCLAMATPAAAGGPYPLEPTGGTMITTLQTFPLGPSPIPPPCPDKPSTLALRTDLDATPAGVGNWSLSGGWSSQYQFILGSGWQQWDFTVLQARGTYTTSPAPPTPYDYNLGQSANLVIRITIHPLTNCVKGAAACTIFANFAMASTSYYDGTLPNAMTGDKTQIDASSATNLVATPCNPPFNVMNGSPAILTDLELTVQ